MELSYILFIRDNEAKEPNPTFENKYYLEKHKDIKNSNLNPLVHHAL